MEIFGRARLSTFFILNISTAFFVFVGDLLPLRAHVRGDPLLNPCMFSVVAQIPHHILTYRPGDRSDLFSDILLQFRYGFLIDWSTLCLLSGPIRRNKSGTGGTKMATFDRKVQIQFSLHQSIRLDEQIHLLFLFVQIGPKMTEIWAETYTPKYGASADFDIYRAIKWPNFNIFGWDLRYMISWYNIHILCDLQPTSS